MLTIFRYPLSSAVNKVNLPLGARILSVGLAENEQNHREEISLWAEVDNENPSEQRTFLIFGTGANMDDTINFPKEFIGTVQKTNKFAFHVFEVKE